MLCCPAVDSQGGAGQPVLTRTARIAYGMGGGVYAVKEAAYNIFILLFYTQVLGLSGSATGLIIAISLLWDGISDPLVGSWSDRLHSRYGRRHPFMTYSAVPAAIGFIGLFSPPQAVVESSVLLGGWLLFWSLWVRTFVTLFSIPHLALSVELSADYQQRSQLLGLRLGVMFLVAVLLPAVGLIVVFSGPEGTDGRFVIENYPDYGLLSGGLLLILAVICVLGTRFNTSRPDHSGEQYRLPSTGEFLSDIGRTLRNRTFRAVVFYDVAASMSWGCASALNILVATYVFELDAAELAFMLAVPSLAAVALVWATLNPLGRHLQKPQILRFALWMMLINSLWLLPLKLAGLLPDNESPVILWLNLLYMGLFMFFFLLRAVAGMSIVADITDQAALKHGERQEGGFFSVVNFTTKIATLFGPLYGGIALDVIGLDRQELPGEVAEPVLTGLMVAMMLGVLPLMLLALVFAYRISFSREQFEEIQANLRNRQEAHGKP